MLRNTSLLTPLVAVSNRSFLRKLSPEGTGEFQICVEWGSYRDVVTQTTSGPKSCNDVNPDWYGFDFDTESNVVVSTDTTGSIDITQGTGIDGLGVVGPGAQCCDFYLYNGAMAAYAGGRNDFDSIECGPNDGYGYFYSYVPYVFPYFYTFCIRTSEGNYVKVLADTTCCGSRNFRYEVINKPPVCPDVIASDAWIPPNGSMVAVSLDAIPSDPDGDDLSIEITSCASSDPHRPKKGMDCELTTVSGQEMVSVRAKRFGNSDGRLYKIGYTATDVAGAVCTGEAFVCIPHDASIGEGATDGETLIDAEELFWETEAKANGKIKRVCPDPQEVEEWYEQLLE